MFILLTESMHDWDERFFPSYTPQEMLELGVFEGKYLNAIKDQFPKAWFKNAKLSDMPDFSLNYYGVKSRKPLSYWKEQGWINEKYDPLGWFQWYCNYYIGRRTPDDQRQINRWRSFIARHRAQVAKHCSSTDKNCRLVQKQALLQWAWNWEQNPQSAVIQLDNLAKIKRLRGK